MNAFTIPESPLHPEPRFTVQPTDRDPASELQRQATFLKLLRQVAPGVIAYANTNGTHIASVSGRRKADREGRHKGVGDLTIVWNCGVAWLEFKSGKGAPSDAQVEFGNKLVALGHRFAVVRTAEFALAWLAEQGCPVRGIL